MIFLAPTRRELFLRKFPNKMAVTAGTTVQSSHYSDGCRVRPTHRFMTVGVWAGLAARAHKTRCTRSADIGENSASTYAK